MKELCEECIRDLKLRADEKNISILLDCQAAQSYRIDAERNSLESSVINNLLTDAIKFSPKNQKIDITLKNTEAATILSVQDYGIGMPPGLVNKIFDFSEHTTRSGTDGEAGTGFGLPIIKMFTDIYNATIEVISS